MKAFFDKIANGIEHADAYPKKLREFTYINGQLETKGSLESGLYDSIVIHGSQAAQNGCELEKPESLNSEAAPEPTVMWNSAAGQQLLELVKHSRNIRFNGITVTEFKALSGQLKE